MSGDGAMTEAELAGWEADFWEEQERATMAQPALGSAEQALWIVVACLGGVGTAVLVMWAVFRAVTLNGRSILLTALFGACIVWIYAIIGYAFARDLFVTDDDG